MPFLRVYLLTIAAAALLAGTSRAESRTAASCSAADVQAAITAALDGDTVLIPAGSASWLSNVTLPDTKGITLQGAGADKTHVTLNGHTLLLQTSSSRAPVRVTGMKFIHTNTAPAIVIWGSAKNWRIDNNIFDSNNVSGLYDIRVGNGANSESFTYGVIDNNQFINRNYATSIFIEWPRGALDAVHIGDWIWSQPAERGTAQAVYIEDNVFSGNGTASQVVDCRWGAKYVLRYNTIHNPWISTHSGFTNGGRNPLWVEIYGNRFTDDSNRYPGFQIEMRSVSGIFWNNTSAVPLNKFVLSIDHERSFRTDGSASSPFSSLCDGTHPWDENAGLHGYRGFGQPGWGPPQVSDMRACSFAGLFAWGNRNGSSPVNLQIGNNLGYSAEHLQAGREFFNAANMGIGPRSARPLTCSPNAPRSVYISTDENPLGPVIYVATAANVWSKHWEPYVYPHPLRMAAPVAPGITSQPANVSVNAGQLATFSVTATGSAPLSYQWQKNGVNIAGATAASYTTPATTLADHGATFRAVITNAAGSVTSSSATLSVSAVPPTQGQTLFTTQTPSTLNARDAGNYELGMRFKASVSGQITAVRFWKASNESGPHIGRIWSAAGTQLASVTFSNETASGWQEQALITPLPINADTEYLVSVNTGNTYYVETVGGLANSIVNGSLSSIVGDNGRYGAMGQYPALPWYDSNYFRDVRFVATPLNNLPPSITSAASATPNPATVGQAVSFAVAASDFDGDSLSYSWSFGDGSSGSGAMVSHAYAATGTFSAAVRVSDGKGGSASSSVVVSVNSLTTNAMAINSGGAASGSYVADRYFSGGRTFATTATISISGVSDPAPQGVYRSERYGNFGYAVPGLTPGASYTVRLHFAEIYYSAAGRRLFNVAINGQQVLSRFDIYDAAGGKYKAVVKEFAATASSSGSIQITFTTVLRNAKCSGIQLVAATQGVASATEVSLPTAEASEELTSARIDLGTVTLNQPCRIQLPAPSEERRLTWKTTQHGELPKGLSLRGGTLSGRPQAAGSFNFTLLMKSKDARGENVYTLTVTP